MKLYSGMVISTEDIKKMADADINVQGTEDYLKYRMCLYTLINKRWSFSGWYPIQIVRSEETTIKIIKDKAYIMCKSSNESHRFEITDDILELMNWER